MKSPQINTITDAKLSPSFFLYSSPQKSTRFTFIRLSCIHRKAAQQSILKHHRIYNRVKTTRCLELNKKKTK